MSYVVQVWEQPWQWKLPRELPAAQAMRRALSLRRAAGSERFVDFARQLTSRYPCITDPASDELDESELAWSDGPLDGKADSAVYAIGLNRERLPEVRPFVIATARACGLCLSDDQAGQVWLPSGAVIDVRGLQCDPSRREGLSIPPEALRAMPDRPDLVRQACAAVEQAVSTLGFSLVEWPAHNPHVGYTTAVFRRDTPFARHELELIVSDQRPQRMTLDLRLETLVHALSAQRLGVIHRGSVPPDAKPLVSFRVIASAWLHDPGGFAGGLFGNWMLLTVDEIERGLQQLRSQLASRLPVLLRPFDDIQSLAAALDVEPPQWSIYFPSSAAYAADFVIAAWLARSPRLGALCEQLLQQLPQAGRQSKSAVGSLLNQSEDANAQHLQNCINYVRLTRPPPA